MVEEIKCACCCYLFYDFEITKCSKCNRYFCRECWGDLVRHCRYCNTDEYDYVTEDQLEQATIKAKEMHKLLHG